MQNAWPQLGKQHPCSDRHTCTKMGWENMAGAPLVSPTCEMGSVCSQPVITGANRVYLTLFPRSFWQPAPKAATGSDGFLKIHSWSCTWSWPHFPANFQQIVNLEELWEKIHQESVNITPQVKLCPTYFKKKKQKKLGNKTFLII